MFNRKKLVIGSCVAGALACGLSLLAHDGRAVAAPQGPTHFVMLACSTETSAFPVLSASSTNPSLRIDDKRGCPEALKAIHDAGYVVIDVEYGDGGRRALYTASSPGQDFNSCRSNKDKR